MHNMDMMNIHNQEVDFKNSLNNLLECLEPVAQPVETHKKTLLHFSNNKIKYCYILEKGHVAINRVEDGLLLYTESAPFIFGFTMLNRDPYHVILCPSEDSVLKRLPLAQAMEIIRQESLWKALCNVMAHSLSRLFAHCTRISQPDIYSTIRYLLLELSQEVDELRKSESVVNYIQRRSFLSRSGISAALAELRRGSYIEMGNGKLISINQLPEKF